MRGGGGGDRTLSAYTGGRAASAGPSLGCQRVGGREKQQERRILCSDDVFYPFRHPAESLHALHSAASCLFVYKCHRKLSKIKKKTFKVKRFKILKYAFAVGIVAFDYAHCCQSMLHRHGGSIFCACGFPCV